MSEKPGCKQNISLPQACNIQAITRQNERTISVFLDSQMEAQPGQFVMAWLPGVGEKPFSIAGVNPLRLTVVNVGAFSQALHMLNVGDRLWIRGPLGHGFQVEPNKNAVLVGGGYGAAPLLYLARKLIEKNTAVTAWLGARSKGEIILVDELTQAGVKVKISTEDGSQGLQGLVTDGLRNTLKEEKVDLVYACGPARMLQAVAAICKDSGVSCQLSWEAMMRCGMGLCGSCELEEEYGEPSGWLVCMDGPVSIRS